MANIQSDFANLTSHQLRTPLSGMKWLLELLQKSDGNLSKKQKDLIEKLYFSNERMIALVNDLLEVSSIEQGKTKLYLQATDLEPIIRAIIKEKVKEVKRKKLQISFTVEHEPLPQVKTERNKIRQVLNNILTNAINYTQETGQIHVELRQTDHSILCKITDNGVGIPKSAQKKVFSKFFRGDNILQFETTGTGLGLYITKKFIEASGGKIWFKSKEGEGTTFYFTLPIAEK